MIMIRYRETTKNILYIKRTVILYCDEKDSLFRTGILYRDNEFDSEQSDSSFAHEERTANHDNWYSAIHRPDLNKSVDHTARK